jgi:hypothetical protein
LIFEIVMRYEVDERPMTNLRQCPCCGKTYGPDYNDVFCICGIELEFTDSGAMLATTAVVPAAPERPPAGTRCLVLYGPDRKPLHYFPLTKDVTVIGRQDPVAGHFPDVDVSAWLDEASARKVSRSHALVLHSRQNDSFTLRPLAGNTGTQIEQEMVRPQEDYPLRPGIHLIFGGVARFKFEIT